MAKRNYFAAAAYVLSFKERNLPVITPYKASLPLHTDKAVKYIFSLSLFMSHTEVSWDEAVIKIQCQEKVGKICFKLSTIKKKKKKPRLVHVLSVLCFAISWWVLYYTIGIFVHCIQPPIQHWALSIMSFAFACTFRALNLSPCLNIKYKQIGLHTGKYKSSCSLLKGRAFKQ